MNIDFSSLNAFDYIVFTIVGLSTLFAFFRGFIHTVLSFFAWIGSIFISIYLFPYLQPLVAGHIGNEIVANIVTFMGTYFLSLIVIIIVNYQILHLVGLMRLTAIDRSLGFAFGLVRGVVLVTLLFMVVTFFVSVFGMREKNDESAESAKPKMPAWLAEAQSFDLLKESSSALIAIVPDNFWQDAKDYVSMFGHSVQMKHWRPTPEVNNAITSIGNQLPDTIQLDIKDKYGIQSWSQIPPDQQQALSQEIVRSYKKLLDEGIIAHGQVSGETINLLDQVLQESQPTDEQVRKLRELLENPEYNGQKQ